MIRRITMLSALAAMLLGATLNVQAQWTIGQNADLVLGQKDFTGNASGLAADSLSAPVGVAVDPTTGKLFVADISNHRVLRWGSAPSLMSGDPAEAVLGQPDFTTKDKRTTQDGMDFPTDLVLDAEGRLYVADALNNRVLRFDSASWKPSGSNADGVLGQQDFTSKTATVTRNGMEYVRGLAVDEAGHLWVSDQGNNRVLRFDNAASKANGADADGVLGQPDFTTNTGDTSQSGMAVPRGLWVDDAGRLWVAVTFINRVMRFDNAANKPNGVDADAVLGQPGFFTSAAETSATGMHRPSGITLDPSGRLYVGDFYNNRVLWFDNAADKPTGASADGVFGQTDLISGSGSVSQNGLAAPWGVMFDRSSNRLWVCDVGNNRVLRFTPSGPLSAEEATGQHPDRFELLQNYPNPFNPSTTIEYAVPRTAHVSLTVYSILGREVARPVDGLRSPGVYEITWDASGLPSGMYFCRLTAGGVVQTRTMVLMK